jgi:beta-lactamase regulating signal transducer with metallopeptidase domain
MFYLLSISLCCAVWFMVFVSASVLCMWTGRLARPAASSLAPATVANLLFAIRILPVSLASLVTFGFVLPALLKFEPRSTSELVGWPLLGLAVLGALALIVMSLRAVNIIRSTRLVAAAWRRHSKRLLLKSIDIPVYCLDGVGPSSVLAVFGFFRPKIFVARKVVDTLTPEELVAALEHERAHMSSLDNLRQLAVKITRLPHWLNLFGMPDSAWTHASEIAADEAALASGVSVLDLSGALIKVAALSSRAVVGETVAASHLVPVGPESSLQARVKHLQEILESDDPLRRTPQNQGGRIVIPLALAVIAYATCVSAVLPWVHEALEELVR